MSIDLIQQRLAQYNLEDEYETAQTIREITQEIILASLARNNFFRVAEFHGGTALRIFYKLQRFSENLDFALIQPNDQFNFMPFVEKIAEELEPFGYQFKIKDRSKAERAVKKAFLKDHSLGHQLTLTPPTKDLKIIIKVEIDTNPPLGANTELKHLQFPVSFGVQTKDLSSSFSSKCHALLCRNYLKGRDWYDFIWYSTQSTRLNIPFLYNALKQTGPWANIKFTLDHNWLYQAFSNKINSISWQIAAEDVRPFVNKHQQKMLDNWSAKFFLNHLDNVMQAQT